VAKPVQPRDLRRRLLDAFGAAVAAGLVFGAVPAVLVLVVGNPLHGGLGHSWPAESRNVLCALALAAWVAWAFCCAQLVRGVVAHLRRGTVGVPAGASVVDRLAARIAIGILAFTSVGAPLALTTPVGAETPSGTHAAAAIRHTTATLVAPDASAPLAHHTHLVRPGETLWSIAETQSGDGADWTSIAALNLGGDMADGARFVDPDQIRAGWRLRMPPVSPRTPHGVVGDAHPSTDHSAKAPEGDHLPELAALGLGSIVSAALARRARRRRQSNRRSGAPLRAVSEDAADAASLLGRFDGVPALESFEAANRLLGRAVHDVSGTRIRAVCVGPAGVTFHLAAPDHDPPEGFERSDDGTRWLVPHGRLEAVEPFYPAVPVALPVGTDDDGTWLVALRPGDVLPVLGESAEALCRAARAAQEAWSWCDLVVVTDDPADHALANAERAVFFGDPSSLGPRRRETTAVVTTAPLPPSDLTVLVDRHGASIHPLGRTVRPQLLSIETSRAVGELIAPADEILGSEVDEVDRFGGIDEDDRLREIDDRVDGDHGRSAMFPGTVDVRLLAASPRIDGLREELPPNRARRAVELVAYLALHHPDAVTSDRLRTRVLGSSDADAASKTLFNTAYAARRAMGSDVNGEALFPAATRLGLYQVSEHVSIDVHRAAALADEGKRTDDPELAMAYLRAALELVEGEPLAHALGGYAWWEAEGHGGRIATVLVGAACGLARLAIEAGHYELARRGLEQARLVEPYSESLSRSAMEVAAAEGDAERLRLEWLDCQRRVDLLDPGSSPSHRTETLYGELSSRVLVEAAGPGVGEGD
jgi:hypothetical protein